jgi:hypothetical protein
MNIILIKSCPVVSGCKIWRKSREETETYIWQQCWINDGTRNSSHKLNYKNVIVVSLDLFNSLTAILETSWQVNNFKTKNYNKVKTRPLIKSSKLCQTCTILVPDYNLVANVGSQSMHGMHGWHAFAIYFVSFVTSCCPFSSLCRSELWASHHHQHAKVFLAITQNQQQLVSASSVGIHCVILLLFLPLRIEMICIACSCLVCSIENLHSLVY